MSEIKGDWYLHYEEFDNMENHRPEVTDKVRLLADSAEEAHEEAKELWEYRLGRGTYRGYDGRTYPQSPSIHQVIDIEQKTFDVVPPKGKPFSWAALHSDDIELRNRIVAAFKQEASRPDTGRVTAFIDSLGMKAQAGENGILAQKNLERDWRWTVRFTFNPNQVLRNIFVDPIEYLRSSTRQEAPQLPLQG